MDKDRRQSALDVENYGKKVRDLEDVKRTLTGKLDEDKRRLADTGNYIKDLEEKSGNIERLYRDANRRNDSTLGEL